MPAPLAGLATVCFCLYSALFPAAVGYAQARFDVAMGVRLMLLVPALWTLAEWLRGWLLTGFPWLALGYSQVEGPFAGFAPLAGVFGVTFASAVVAGALTSLIAARGRRITLATMIVVVVSGAILRGIEWTSPQGEPLTVSLVQGNIPQELKFVAGRYEATLDTYARLVEKSQGRLVVLPETAIPRFLGEVAPSYLERLERHARERNGDILFGVPIAESGRRYYNAVISRGTSPPQRYEKFHLVPFGEFVPPGFGWVVAVLHIPLSDFTRGAEMQSPLAVAGQRVAVNICYEDLFGEEIIRQLPEATLLVNVSNVAWFGDSLAPAQHLRISRMRALETGRAMLRATNTGVTAIIDQRGRVTARLPAFTEGILEEKVQGHTGASPYVLAGNYAIVVGCGVLIMALLGTRQYLEKRRANADLGRRA
jgi:apolipoprotein N-acyltransferase